MLQPATFSEVALNFYRQKFFFFVFFFFFYPFSLSKKFSWFACFCMRVHQVKKWRRKFEQDVNLKKYTLLSSQKKKKLKAEALIFSWALKLSNLSAVIDLSGADLTIYSVNLKKGRIGMHKNITENIWLKAEKPCL